MKNVEPIPWNWKSSQASIGEHFNSNVQIWLILLFYYGVVDSDTHIQDTMHFGCIET